MKNDFMQKQQTTRLKLSLLASALLLSACGGGGGGSSSQPQPEQPIKPLVSSFSSSLTLQDKGQPVQAISARATSEDKDNTPAYTVSTSLSNNWAITIGESRDAINFPKISQTFSFQLTPVKNAIVLDIEYDTLTQKVIDITLTRNKGSSVPDILTCSVSNGISTGFNCQGITFNYIAASGKLSIHFNNTVLRKTASLPPEVHTLALNGQLDGELSQPPQDVQNIPHTSSGNIIVNGKTQKILAASNSISSMGRTRTALTALLENGNRIYFGKNPAGELESRYLVANQFGTAQPENISQLSQQSTAQSDIFQLNTTRFNFNALVIAEPPAPVNVSGTLTVPKPVQQFSYAPVVPAGVDASSYWYGTNSPLRHSFIPEGVRITLVNHDQVALESTDFTAVIKHKKLQSIRISRLFGGSMSTLRVIDYSCGDQATACQGATVSPDGYGILFSNTTLSNNRHDGNELPAAITLNGGLVYPGR